MEYELKPSDIARFRSKVVQAAGCWRWTGSHFKTTGYALFNVKCADGVWRPTVAHRTSYTINVGPIPDGLQIDHLCRNRWCVNPAHLEPVTQRENGRRGISPAARNITKTHCLNGHEFTPENTYVKQATGARDCRECARERDRKRAPSRRGYVPPSRRR